FRYVSQKLQSSCHKDVSAYTRDPFDEYPRERLDEERGFTKCPDQPQGEWARRGDVSQRTAYRLTGAGAPKGQPCDIVAREGAGRRAWSSAHERPKRPPH